MKKSEKVNTAVVVQSLEKKSRSLITKLSNITSITTQEEFDKAGKVTKELKAYGKIATAEMNTILNPLNQSIKATREHFRPFFNRLAEAETRIKGLMLEFTARQKALSEKVDRDFEDGKIKKISTYASKKMKTEVKSGAAKVRHVWKLTVVNEKKIPREYLMPDIGLIERAFKEGKEVPGCKYEQVEQIAI